MDRAALGRLNTKSLQEKIDEKAKLLVSVDDIFECFVILALCVAQVCKCRNYGLDF